MQKNSWKILVIVLILLGAGLYFLSNSSKTKSEKVLRVGVTAGPHVAIMEKIQPILQEAGIHLKIVEFAEFMLPNAALDAGDLDLNSFQHQPFLDEQIKIRGYKLATIAKTILLPIGAYSKTYKNIEELPEGAKIAIPNDPTNGVRSLLLLQKTGLIDFKPMETPSVLNIVKNTKNLKILELESPQLTRALDDVAMAVINTDWVLSAGMDPHSAILREDSNSPYTNIIVVRQGDEKRAEILALVQAYHSQVIRDFIESTFKGAVLAAW